MNAHTANPPINKLPTALTRFFEPALGGAVGFNVPVVNCETPDVALVVPFPTKAAGVTILNH
jgi:hypothetical protein